jgi:hypothetical protein
MPAKHFGADRQKLAGQFSAGQKRSDGGTVTVPVPLHRAVRIGALQSIIRQSGIPRERFLV